jgi:outer membrane cobalamin receptor
MDALWHRRTEWQPDKAHERSRHVSDSQPLKGEQIMAYSNLYFLEHTVKAHAEEAQHEARAQQLVRQARGKQEWQLSARLHDLRCRLLDLAVALGFALERCTLPLEPVSK